jgi:glycine/D-amino acid oxidase-like deaminating enzyme
MRQRSAYDEEVRDFAPPSAANQSLTCDLLVAGGGLSGLSAAEAALRRGLDVVVIEKGVFGKDAASGLNAGQFLTGWAKPVDVMVTELTQQELRRGTTRRGDVPSGGCGRSCAARSRAAFASPKSIAATTCVPPCSMGRSRPR